MVRASHAHRGELVIRAVMADERNPVCGQTMVPEYMWHLTRVRSSFRASDLGEPHHIIGL